MSDRQLPRSAGYFLAATSDRVRRALEIKHGRPLLDIARSMEAYLARNCDQSAPMQRWTADELATVRQYLEALDKDAWTADDHYLLAEWLVQRYRPADDTRTEGEWHKTIAGLRAKIDENIARIARGEPKPEPPPDDPDFAMWLKEHLSGKKK